jgi:hypothetical protein
MKAKNKKYASGTVISGGKISATIYVLVTPGEGFYSKQGFSPRPDVASAGFFKKSAASRRLHIIKRVVKKPVFVVPIPLNFDFEEMSFIASLAQDNQELLATWSQENINKKDDA